MFQTMHIQKLQHLETFVVTNEEEEKKTQIIITRKIIQNEVMVFKFERRLVIKNLLQIIHSICVIFTDVCICHTNIQNVYINVTYKLC